MSESKVIASSKDTASAPIAPKENARPKSTLNLQNILKTPIKAEEKPLDSRQLTVAENKLVDLAELKKAWDDFAELKKTQAGEYNLLKRGFEIAENKITISLANPVEEPLLQSIRTQLTAFLRDKLNNSNLNVVGVMQEIETKRVAYTNKEKFDYLAQKNPILLELKERFGLDPDF